MRRSPPPLQVVACSPSSPPPGTTPTWNERPCSRCCTGGWTGSPLRIDGDARQVLVLRTDGIHPASIGDDHLGGYLATRKLIDHGHTRIGLIMGPEHATTAVQRRNGYRAALTEAGIPLDDSLIAGDAYTMEAGEAAAHTLLNH